MYKSHGAKGQQIDPRLFFFFYSFSSRNKRRSSFEEPKCKKVARKEERWGARERQIKMERPAGASGKVTRKAFGSFRRPLNG